MANAEEVISVLQQDIVDASIHEDYFKMRGILEDISSSGFTDGEIDQLKKDFDSFAPNRDWFEQAKAKLYGLQSAFADDLNNPGKRQEAEDFTKQYMEHRGDGFSALTEEARSYQGTDKTRPVREALEGVRGRQQFYACFQALIEMMGLDKRGGISQDVLRSTIFRYNGLGRNLMVDGAPTDFDNLIPNSRLVEVKEDFERLLTFIDKDPAVPEDFGRIFAEKHARYPEGQQGPDIEEIRLADNMKKSLSDIQSTYERLADEGKKLFGDSKQYKDMMAAAKRVCDIGGSADMDFSDPKKLHDLYEAMDELHKTSQIYAEKEAYKSKRTKRGISRKNGALAFLELTDLKADREIEQRSSGKEMQDMRLNDKESRKVTKTSRSYGELVSQEIKNNKEYHERKRQRAQGMDRQKEM